MFIEIKNPENHIFNFNFFNLTLIGIDQVVHILNEYLDIKFFEFKVE